MPAYEPFENVVFVCDDDVQIEAVTARCVSCDQERSLSFAKVIGGIALRCPICGSRDLAGTKKNER